MISVPGPDLIRGEERERFLNVPNLLTLIRFGLVPVFLFQVLARNALGALLVFSLAGLTDVLDGMAARVWRLKTKIGMLLDPLADKSLLTTAFILLTFPSRNSPYSFPVWLTATVLARDFVLIAGGLVIFRLRGRKEFPPSIYGKISTILQVGTVFWVLFSKYIRVSSWNDAALLSALTSPAVLSTLYYLTLAFTGLSGAHYVLKGIGMTFSRQK
jgi:cardiolipin synthase